MAKNGFTLIEMLVVLSLLSILILLAVPLQFSILDKQTEEQFINQLKYDVLLIQNQAGKNTKYRMSIHFNRDHYLIRYGINDFARRSYPEGWSFIGSESKLEFKESGTVLNPRAIVMRSDNEYIPLVFPLGKGRFYVGTRERIHTH